MDTPGADHCRAVTIAAFFAGPPSIRKSSAFVPQCARNLNRCNAIIFEKYRVIEGHLSLYSDYRECILNVEGLVNDRLATI